MCFYQNPPPVLSGDWKWLVSEAFSVSRACGPEYFQTIAQYKFFLLGRGGKGVYTTFSKDYTINLNNFREYFQEQLSR